MAHKIDGISYPETWAELKKDKKLLKIFAAHCKKSMIIENYYFLTRRPIANKDFFTYVAPGSMLEINISSAMRGKFMKHYVSFPKYYNPKSKKDEIRIDWKDKDWGKLFEAAENEVITMMETDHLEPGGRSFWASKVFKTYHAKATGGKAPPADETPAKPADWKKLQLLGFESAKNKIVQKRMGEMIAALKVKDKRAANKAMMAALTHEPEESRLADVSYTEMVKYVKKFKMLR